MLTTLTLGVVMDTPPLSAPAPRVSRRGSVLGVLGAITLTAAITGALYGREALSAGTAPKIPLTVSTVSFQTADNYQREASYLGLITAGEKAQLSFEVGGKIAAIEIREGSAVAAGEVLATLDDAQLRARRRAMNADLDQARAELELARLKSRRQEELSSTGAVSREAVDETRLQAEALASRVSAIEARLDSIDIDLDKTRLLAPYSGVVAQRFAYPGSVVNPGTPVLRLLQSGLHEAHIGVAAEKVDSLIIGKHYELTLRDQLIEAELRSVRPDVDPLTRSVTAVFALPPGVAALDGEPIALRMHEQVHISGGWLPVSSLLEGRRGVWNVLKIQRDGDSITTAREVVEIVAVQGDQAYVRGTLPQDAEVVSDGVHRITPGNTVTLAGTR